MPRKKRVLSATGIYHVVIKGTNSQLMFEEKRDYLKYLDILEYQKSECDFKVYAYCLMSNHVHLLIHSSSTPLDIIFKKVNTTYSCWFNMKYRRTGPLQDGRFYSEPVDNEEYFLCVLRYIHCNPAKAGIEKYPGEKYEWSSFFSYADSLDDFVDTSVVLEQIGGLNNFMEFHSSSNNDDCLDINKVKKRIPDEVATAIIKEICNVTATTDVSKFPTMKRNGYVRQCKERGVSANQLNRLTGIPKGIINRILANRL